MKPLKGTRTAENLLRAFAGESQARNRYTFYSKAATKEGYVQIANLFMETADNEKEHADIFFRLLNESLNGENVEITAGYPVALGDTKANLDSAAKGENDEWTHAYPEFARIAQEEGFETIANTFKKIAEIEKRHETRFVKLLSNLNNNQLYKKNKPVLWKCNNCGYIYEGEEAPKVCPACLHPQGYFELFAETY